MDTEVRELSIYWKRICPQLVLAIAERNITGIDSMTAQYVI